MQVGDFLLTANGQNQGFCKEGFGLLRLGLVSWINRVLWHQFEEMEEQLVQRAAPLKILSIMSTQLETNMKSNQYRHRT